MRDLAPIIVFAFNRPNVLKKTLDSLKNNQLAKDSDLFIFIDGPKQTKDIKLINEVLEISKAICGFKSITIKKSEKNKGLAPSIISGVTEIINIYGKVIVVEDDLFLSKKFLVFMNQMLDEYKNEQKIFQVSGFGVKINKPYSYQADAYFNIRAQCWTWGTWKDRWETIDWDVKDYSSLLNNKKEQHAFNQAGSDMFGMLKRYKEGVISSWYIRFCYSMFKQKKLSVCPIRSLVINNGFGEDATHCHNYNRYKTDFDYEGKEFYTIPKNSSPVINHKIQNQVLFYWSIPYRIYGKILTYILDIRKKIIK